MKDRVGSCYLVDHGFGRQSMKLVVERVPAGWIVVHVEDNFQERSMYVEETLSHWDELSLDLRGNIRRIS